MTGKDKDMPVSNLGTTVESVMAEASVMCTQCLINAVSEESSGLGAKVGHLLAASSMRHRGRHWEAWYQQAFTEVMSSLLVIAVFSAELSTSRGVAWKDINPPPEVQISLN